MVWRTFNGSSSMNISPLMKVHVYKCIAIINEETSKQNSLDMSYKYVAGTGKNKVQDGNSSVGRSSQLRFLTSQTSEGLGDCHVIHKVRVSM